jgi:hypothetical protein
LELCDTCKEYIEDCVCGEEPFEPIFEEEIKDEELR